MVGSRPVSSSPPQPLSVLAGPIGWEVVHRVAAGGKSTVAARVSDPYRFGRQIRPHRYASLEPVPSRLEFCEAVAGLCFADPAPPPRSSQRRRPRKCFQRRPVKRVRRAKRVAALGRCGQMAVRDTAGVSFRILEADRAFRPRWRVPEMLPHYRLAVECSKQDHSRTRIWGRRPRPRSS